MSLPLGPRAALPAAAPLSRRPHAGRPQRGAARPLHGRGAALVQHAHRGSRKYLPLDPALAPHRRTLWLAHAGAGALGLPRPGGSDLQRVRHVVASPRAASGSRRLSSRQSRCDRVGSLQETRIKSLFPLRGAIEFADEGTARGQGADGSAGRLEQLATTPARARKDRGIESVAFARPLSHNRGV